MGFQKGRDERVLGDCDEGDTCLCCVIVSLARLHRGIDDVFRFYSAYEYMKRRFIKQYGGVDRVPVWALLASGSCGGVSLYFSYLHSSFIFD